MGLKVSGEDVEMLRDDYSEELTTQELHNIRLEVQRC